MKMREIIDLVEAVQLAERYETLPPQLVYHGSKKSVVQKFEYRKGVRAAFFDAQEVTANGFFFAQRMEDAREFGQFVGAYRIDLKHPLIAGADGIDGIKDPKRNADVRYVLSALMQPDGDDGHHVFHGMTNDIWAKPEHMAAEPEDRDEDWIYHFLGSGGLDWEVLDHPEVIKRMVERGYDGTAVHEPGAMDSRAWFVIRPEQVHFVEQVWPQQDHDDEEW